MECAKLVVDEMYEIDPEIGKQNTLYCVVVAVQMRIVLILN